MTPRTFWFCDDESGEEFFVEEMDLVDATRIAKDFFVAPRLIEEVSYEFAEMLGLDTY